MIEQNVKFAYGEFNVVTTMTRIFVYRNKKFIGSAGVKNPKDFDFKALFKIAIHETGSSIEL